MTRRSIWRTLVVLFAVLAVWAPVTFATAKPKLIEVFVKKVQPGPRRVEYHYTVANGSAFPITTLLIGFDEYYGVPRLNCYPIGWDGDSIPETSYRSPPGWEFSVVPTEEESRIDIRWGIVSPASKSSPGRTIRSGRTLEGFVVVLEQTDSTYDAGGLWTAYVIGDSPHFGALKRSK